MGQRLLQFLVIAAIFVGVPTFVADSFLTQRQLERIAEARQDYFRHMEDVLHRVKRNGRPEYLCKSLIDKTSRRVAKGADPRRALEKLFRTFPRDWEFQVFSAERAPLEFDGKKPTKVAVRQKLVQCIFNLQSERVAPSATDEKIASQIYGDSSAITILAGGEGHFRKFGNPVLYSHGGWWRISNGKTTLFLFALLKADGFRNDRLLRQACRTTSRRVKSLFSIALTGSEKGPSFRRLPEVVRRLVTKISGGQGRFENSRLQGVSVACPNDLSLRAWRSFGAVPTEREHLLQIIVRAAAGLFLVLLIRLIIFGNPSELSLKLVVPALILGGTLPVLGYLGLTMTEQRGKRFDKEMYQTHREIEDRLRQIDADLSVRMLTISGRYRQMLREISERPTRLEEVKVPPQQFHSSIHAGFLFGKDGRVRSTLFAPGKNLAAQKSFVEALATKFTDAFYGRAHEDTYEDPLIPFYLKRLGSFLEVKFLGTHNLEFVDIRQLSHSPRDIVGVFLEHRVDAFMKSYLREILRTPATRRGLRFALVSHEEGVVLRSAPAAFLRNPDALRLGEQVLETGKTVDAILPVRGGETLIVTAFPCRNLSGYLLIGGTPLSGITQEDERLGIWTLCAAGSLILLGLISAGLLAMMIVEALKSLGSGVESIRRNEYTFTIAVTGSDEFAELARGIEKAALTLEEVYSSLPVQETLVRCDPLEIGDFSLAGSFRPGPEPGGDYLDAFPIGDGKVLLAAGDVLGVGWQTTLVVSAVKMAVRLIFTRPFASLGEAVARLNRHFMGVRGSLKRMSLLVAILDTTTGTLEVVGAGHCPPILIRNGAGRLLPNAGVPLGVDNEKSLGKYQETLRKGDRLLIYTDGWIKSRDSAGVGLGYTGFVETVTKMETTAPVAILEEIQALVERSGHSDFSADDRTALALVFREPGSEVTA